MRKQSIHALILATTLGWGGQSTAQVDSPVPTQHVERATIPNRLFSIGRLLLNPNDRRQPVPLFGYSTESLNKDQNVVDRLVQEAQAGRVRLAMVTARPHGENNSSTEYVGWGIVNLNDVRQQIENMQTTGDENLLALTRPLRGIEATEEFIGDSSLWFPPTQSSSLPNVYNSIE